MGFSCRRVAVHDVRDAVEDTRILIRSGASRSIGLKLRREVVTNEVFGLGKLDDAGVLQV